MIEMFTIETDLKIAILKTDLSGIAVERRRDEFMKILPYGSNGMKMLRDLNLMQYIIPELSGDDVGGGRHHCPKTTSNY